jgi:hypothetical protein
MTTLKPPKKFYEGMDKLWRRFLWAGNQQLHGGKCKVSWARVCRPLNHGGLGITDLERFGRALILCWLWLRWKQPEKLWANTELLTMWTKLSSRRQRESRYAMVELPCSRLPAGLTEYRRRQCFLLCMNTARGRGEQWLTPWQMIIGFETSFTTSRHH